MDTLQGIVQEMGLYLGLEGIKTDLFYLMLLHFHLVHKYQDLLHHGVKPNCKLGKIFPHMFHVDTCFQGT